MALLTHFNDTNKVITQGKCVSYSSNIEHGTWSYTPAPNVQETYNSDFRIVRTCVYSYQYVGMDYATAQSCKTYFEQQLKRDLTISSWNPNTGEFEEIDGGEQVMATIRVSLMEGRMYMCTIDIQERDERLRIEDVNNPESLFAEENQREYDFEGQ